MDDMAEMLWDLECTLVHLIKDEMSKDLSMVNTEETGLVVDMLKDMSETERNMRQACYFKTVTKAMNDGRVRYTTNDEVVVKSI